LLDNWVTDGHLAFRGVEQIRLMGDAGWERRHWLGTCAFDPEVEPNTRFIFDSRCVSRVDECSRRPNSRLFEVFKTGRRIISVGCRNVAADVDSSW
jgi:hypothetical protein